MKPLQCAHVGNRFVEWFFCLRGQSRFADKAAEHMPPSLLAKTVLAKIQGGEKESWWFGSTLVKRGFPLSKSIIATQGPSHPKRGICMYEYISLLLGALLLLSGLRDLNIFLCKLC